MGIVRIDDAANKTRTLPEANMITDDHSSLNGSAAISANGIGLKMLDLKLSSICFLKSLKLTPHLTLVTFVLTAPPPPAHSLRLVRA